MSFLEQLKFEADKINGVDTNGFTKESISKKVDPVINRVRVDLVLDRNRIDIFFERKPDISILTELKNYKFRWNPDSKAWYNRDSNENREFLNRLLKANIELLNEVIEEKEKPMLNVLVRPDSLNAEETIEETVTNDNTPFGIYKRQCDQLVKHLKCEHSDLPLIAVKHLYEFECNKLNVQSLG